MNLTIVPRRTHFITPRFPYPRAGAQVESTATGIGRAAHHDMDLHSDLMETNLMPGERVGEHFRISAMIGSGSMGVVYRAVDERLKRDIAIKFMRNAKAQEERLRHRFALEAQAMARIRHDNVVRIHDFGEHRGTPYYVMELIEGQDLSDWMSCAQRQGGFAADAELFILDICAGVGAIHRAGIVHRDLKPGNLIIDQNKRVLVADFGLAEPSDARTNDPGRVAGTPKYLAPEVVLGDVQSRYVDRIDVYSLGCISYELLTGVAPFSGETCMQLLQAHVHEPPRKASELNPALTAEIDAALAHALEKDPEHRTASVAQFQSELFGMDLHPEDGPSKRILVVDDDHDHRRLLSAMIRELIPGLEVTEVEDAVSAEIEARRSTPAAVLTDLDMPGRDGMELAKILKSHPVTRDVPIVMITGRGGPKEWAELREIGVHSFFLKPVDSHALAASLGRLLSTSSTLPSLESRCLLRW